ncbi:MAG: polyprenyl synthetase family protein [Candidatus Eisenbacteria bacterium]|nr:polyprenyl synthetase family protein [Candidatus Eisenbacteria bacterium]
MQHSLRAFFRSRVMLIEEVGDHLLEMSGKRFRPALTLLISRLGGEPRRDPVAAACVIELIHTATLVHDDTIDKSALRRGMPTINSLYNDLVSTIFGDYIYTKALVELIDRNDDDLFRVVTRTTYQMSIGEMLQIQQKRCASLKEAEYLELVDAKTASLMAASCEVGALIADLSPEQVESLRAFGTDLGRAYQITDDIFDYVGDTGELGKYGLSDLAEGKVTLPLIRALGACDGRDRSRVEQILRSPELKGEDWRFVLELLASTGALEECRRTALDLAGQAVGRLDGFNPSPYLDGLREAVEYAVKRSH